MHELSTLEIAQVSGGKPLGFFCSYLLTQQKYGIISAVSIATALSVTCALPGLSAVTATTITNAVVANLANSIAGYCIASLTGQA